MSNETARRKRNERINSVCGSRGIDIGLVHGKRRSGRRQSHNGARRGRTRERRSGRRRAVGRSRYGKMDWRSRRERRHAENWRDRCGRRNTRLRNRALVPLRRGRRRIRARSGSRFRHQCRSAGDADGHAPFKAVVVPEQLQRVCGVLAGVHERLPFLRVVVRPCHRDARLRREVPVDAHEVQLRGRRRSDSPRRRRREAPPHEHHGGVHGQVDDSVRRLAQLPGAHAGHAQFAVQRHEVGRHRQVVGDLGLQERHRRGRDADTRPERHGPRRRQMHDTGHADYWPKPGGRQMAPCRVHVRRRDHQDLH